MKKYPQIKKSPIFFILLAAFLVACGLSAPKQTPKSEPSPQMMNPPSQIAQEHLQLPAPLYYLQAGQIWRLDTNAQTQQQITHETSPIVSFDVSPAHGKLAYIVENSLVTVDADGKNRVVLRAGADLLLQPDPIARFNQAEFIESALRTPLWSPDGGQIAFIENGLMVLDLDTNQAVLIWPQAITSSEPILFENVLSWSPNGSYLLVSQYPYPIESLYQRTLSVLQLDGPLYRGVAPSTQVTFAWSLNTHSLFLANALDGSDQSLMHCDPETMQCRLIAEYEPGRWDYFYAFPFVNTDERLLVFMSASENPSQPPDVFTLTSLRLDGSERTTLRSDGYLVDRALWSRDGRGVVITLEQDAGGHPAGSMLWLGVENEPAHPLPVMDASNLRWGKPGK